MLQPGESKDVSINVTTNDLRFYNSDLKFDWEAGDFIIYIGPNSRDVKQAKVSWVK
jgi:beta-glucosidase